jgi:hypothetical protein
MPHIMAWPCAAKRAAIGTLCMASPRSWALPAWALPVTHLCNLASTKPLHSSNSPLPTPHLVGTARASCGHHKPLADGRLDAQAPPVLV